MQATAKWLTQADVQRTRDNSVATAKAMVRSAFPAWPECRADALLDASMTLWGRGPLITANILVRTAELITAAYDMHEHIAGVMLLRKGEGYTPLWLHRQSLALKMLSPTALWIDFETLKEADR